MTVIIDLAQLTILYTLIDTCGVTYNDQICNDVIVFPPTYFNSPFLPKKYYLNTVREKYRLVDKIRLFLGLTKENYVLYKP
jgi:hypothetical protein